MQPSRFVEQNFVQRFWRAFFCLYKGMDVVICFYRTQFETDRDRRHTMRSKSPELMDKIKKYVEGYALDNGGRTPTTRQIGAAVGVTNVCVSRYLRAMNDMGLVRYNKGEISTDLIDKISISPKLAPSYEGSIPAGPAYEVDASVDEFVSIPTVFTDGIRGKHYILRVTGVSMVDAGIEPGDLLIIREQADARENDIVVALLEGSDNTLKRYCVDEDGPYLWAENERWSEERRFFGRDFEIQGVAIKVVKDL